MVYFRGIISFSGRAVFIGKCRCPLCGHFCLQGVAGIVNGTLQGRQTAPVLSAAKESNIFIKAGQKWEGVLVQVHKTYGFHWKDLDKYLSKYYDMYTSEYKGGKTWLFFGSPTAEDRCG